MEVQYLPKKKKNPMLYEERRFIQLLHQKTTALVVHYDLTNLCLRGKNILFEEKERILLSMRKE